MTKWLNGLGPGAAAAIVASLVSLPLESPDDVLLNTATVTIGALLVGLIAGAVWNVLEQRPAGRQLYVLAMAGGFGIAAVITVVSEALLSGSIKFMLPLAALTFGMTAVLTPIAARVGLGRIGSLTTPTVSLVVALAIGIGLAGQGDAESGKLSLPDVQATPPTEEVVTADDVEGVTYAIVPGESQMTYTVREKLAVLPLRDRPSQPTLTP